MMKASKCAVLYKNYIIHHALGSNSAVVYSYIIRNITCTRCTYVRTFTLGIHRYVPIVWMHVLCRILHSVCISYP